LGEFLLGFGIVWRGKTGGEFEEIALASEFGRELDVIEAVGFFCILRRCGVSDFTEVGGDLFGVYSDEVFLDPGGALSFDAEIEEALFGGFDEFLSVGGGGVLGLRLHSSGGEEEEKEEEKFVDAVHGELPGMKRR